MFFLQVIHILKIYSISRWIKIEGFKFDDSKLEDLQLGKSSLEEILHSGQERNDLDMRNSLETFDVNSIHDCTRKCLTMSACDMIEHNFDRKHCRMFPYLSLKDELWHSFAKSNPDHYIFVLQCSTALEDLMIGNDFEPETTQESRWTFDGDTREAIMHEHVEETLDLLSSARYFLRISSQGITSSQMGMKTTISESDLPLGMNNDFLTSFPQTALLRGNGISGTTLDFTLNVDDATMITRNDIGKRFGIDIVPHMLMTNFTLKENLTVSLTTKANTQSQSFGRINLLMNMPINLGCFKVTFDLNILNNA